MPFAGGSASDVVTRVMLNEMSKSLGNNMIVNNRPGAGGNSGTAAAARAAPDGYTLVMSTSGPLAANKTLFKTLGYRTEKDFAPISLFAVLPNVIVINSKLPPKTLTEFIAYAKAHPQNSTTARSASEAHNTSPVPISSKLRASQLTHVPYRNIAQYTPDFIRASPAWIPVPAERTRHAAKRRRADARRHQQQRMTALPDVPTTAEAGLKNYETFGWLALLAPAGTPQPIIEKIYKALAEARERVPPVAPASPSSAPAGSAPGPRSCRSSSRRNRKWREIIQNGRYSANVRGRWYMQKRDKRRAHRRVNGANGGSVARLIVTSNKLVRASANRWHWSQL